MAADSGEKSPYVFRMADWLENSKGGGASLSSGEESESLLDSLKNLGFCFVIRNSATRSTFSELFASMDQFFYHTPKPLKDLCARGMTSATADIGYYLHPPSYHSEEIAATEANSSLSSSNDDETNEQRRLQNDKTTHRSMVVEVTRGLETFTVRQSPTILRDGFPWPMAPSGFQHNVECAFEEYIHITQTVLSALFDSSNSDKKESAQSSPREHSVLFLRSGTTEAMELEVEKQQISSVEVNEGDVSGASTTSAVTKQAGVDAHTDSGVLTCIPVHLSSSVPPSENVPLSTRPTVDGLQFWSHALKKWVDAAQELSKLCQLDPTKEGDDVFIVFAGEAFPPRYLTVMERRQKQEQSTDSSSAVESSSSSKSSSPPTIQMPITSVGIHRVIPPDLASGMAIVNQKKILPAKEEIEDSSSSSCVFLRRLSAPFQLRLPMLVAEREEGCGAKEEAMRMTNLGVKMLSFS